MTIDKPFVLLKVYSDGSGQPVVIYVGSSKTEAFDALMVFAKKDYFDAYNLKVEYCPNYYSDDAK